jgi:nicotinamide riboside kinase
VATIVAEIDRMIRIVFTGSESTGKSTIAADVARHYRVEVVPEFVRAFAETKGAAIEFSDHGLIARGQMALEDEYIARAQSRPASPDGAVFLLQDTDLLSTVVYCRHYFGRSPEWIEAAARARRPDLYLLCLPDIPWVPDGVRDRGHMRLEMHHLFHDAVTASGAPALSLSGDRAQRLALAIAAIDTLRQRPPVPATRALSE